MSKSEEEKLRAAQQAFRGLRPKSRKLGLVDESGKVAYIDPATLAESAKARTLRRDEK